MSARLPDVYSSLGPFREAFARQVPILMYHKVGPRPSRVRLKGMYVEPRLFRRQMKELGAAGFTSASPDAVLSGAQTPPPKIVLTFDDGYRNVLEHALEPMRAVGLQAIQFIIPDLIGKRNEWDIAQGEAPEPLMNREEIGRWLAAGHDIGAHTCTHPHLTKIPLQQAREEIISSRRKLEDLFQRPIVHFCYPFGDWNESVRDIVAEAGFKTAVTTTSGFNSSESARFALLRFTARHQSRSLKAWWRRLSGR